MEGYIDKNGNYYEGDRQRDDLVVPKRPSSFHIWNVNLMQWEEDIEAAKVVAYNEVVKEVGNARLKYIVSTPTQSATYIDKANEAERYKAAGYPLPLDANTYPYVSGSARARGLTPQEAADFIISEYIRLRRLNGNNVEYVREQADIQIKAASTLAAINSIKIRAINALKVV